MQRELPQVRLTELLVGDADTITIDDGVFRRQSTKAGERDGTKRTIPANVKRGRDRPKGIAQDERARLPIEERSRFYGDITRIDDRKIDGTWRGDFDRRYA